MMKMSQSNNTVKLNCFSTAVSFNESLVVVFVILSQHLQKQLGSD